MHSAKISRAGLLACASMALAGAFAASPAATNAPAASAAYVGAVIVVVLDCIMTFFGSSANDAAFNAWVTDSTDATNRGAVEGINSMMPLVAILVVFGGFMGFDLN